MSADATDLKIQAAHAREFSDMWEALGQLWEARMVPGGGAHAQACYNRASHCRKIARLAEEEAKVWEETEEGIAKLAQKLKDE